MARLPDGEMTLNRCEEAESVLFVYCRLVFLSAWKHFSLKSSTSVQILKVTSGDFVSRLQLRPSFIKKIQRKPKVTGLKIDGCVASINYRL